MKFQSLRNALLTLLACGLAGFLTACGGGGAAGSPQGGILAINPPTGTMFAGVPTTFTIVGGRPPYFITSSEATILSVPSEVSGSTFTVVANNPGVINTGLGANDLPIRSVRITVRESSGTTATSSMDVAQNFLTGYGVSFTPRTCPNGSSAGADPTAQACAGGETAVQFNATFNGTLAGNRVFRLEVLRGNFSLRNPVTGQVSNTITVNSDHTGRVEGIILVPANVPTQLAVIRVIDAATGVYADTVFVISGLSASQNLTAIPNTFRFTGPLTTTCGTGSADFMVFDGVAPYTAVSSFAPDISVTPSSSTNPGRFTLTANNPNRCIDNGTIVITDALGGRTTVTVTTEAGSIAPPAPVALSVGPSAITLGCGQSGSVTVIGGNGFSVTSTSAAVTAVASGSSVTITRANTGTSPTSVGIGITDGRTVVTVTATVPATCP